MNIKEKYYNLKINLLIKKYNDYRFLGYTFDDKELKNEFLLDQNKNILYQGEEIFNYEVPIYLIFEKENNLLFIELRKVKFLYIKDLISYIYHSNFFKKSKDEYTKEFLERQQQIKKFTTIIELLKKKNSNYDLVGITQDEEEFYSNIDINNISFKDQEYMIPTYAVFSNNDEIIFEKIIDMKFWNINEVLNYFHEKKQSEYYNKNLTEWEQYKKEIKKKRR